MPAVAGSATQLPSMEMRRRARAPRKSEQDPATPPKLLTSLKSNFRQLDVYPKLAVDYRKQTGAYRFSRPRHARSRDSLKINTLRVER